LAALAAPERLRILRLLRDGPQSVSALARLLDAPLVNVSHHLAVLRNAHLVRSQRQGRFMIYSVPPDVFQCACGPAAMDYINLGCCRLEVPGSPKG
jgi:DNA-binding transcriptional ArsR family regulator